MNVNAQIFVKQMKEAITIIRVFIILSTAFWIASHCSENKDKKMEMDWARMTNAIRYTAHSSITRRFQMAKGDVDDREKHGEERSREKLKTAASPGTTSPSWLQTRSSGALLWKPYVPMCMKRTK